MNELIPRTKRDAAAERRRRRSAAPTGTSFSPSSPPDVASLDAARDAARDDAAVASPASRISTRATRAACAAAALLVAALPAHAAGGQLNLIPDPVWLMVMIVSFVVLIFPVNAILFQPLFRALDERADRIEGAKSRAAQLAEEASQIVERYDTAVRRERESAEKDRRQHLDAARQEQSQITADARAEAERELEHARGELARSLEEARATLRGNAQELAGEAAERILGRSVS